MTVHIPSVDCVNPCARSAAFGAHAQLSLSSKKNILLFVHDHVRAQGKPAHGSFANALLRSSICHARRNAQLAVASRPGGKARTDTCIGVVLVKQRSSTNIRGSYFCRRKVCGAIAAAPGRGRRMSNPSNFHSKTPTLTPTTSPHIISSILAACPLVFNSRRFAMAQSAPSLCSSAVSLAALVAEPSS